MGVCNIVSRVATVFAPYLAELKPDAISQGVFCLAICIAFFTVVIFIDDSKIEEPTKKKPVVNPKGIEPSAAEKMVMVVQIHSAGFQAGNNAKISFNGF